MLFKEADRLTKLVHRILDVIFFYLSLVYIWVHGGQ